MVMIMSPERREIARPYIRLGREVKRAREAAGVTQEELAERAHISPSYVGAIETGTRAPHPRVLHVLAEVLNVRAELLLELAGHVPPRQPDETITITTDSTEKAAVLQRFAAWTAKQLLDLERMGRIAFLESVPPPGGVAEQPADEEPGEDQPHS